VFDVVKEAVEAAREALSLVTAKGISLCRCQSRALLAKLKAA
jgi:hypothetical protein